MTTSSKVMTKQRGLDPGSVERRFTSPLHDERIAAILGIALGLSFTICFATGLWSHLVQHPPSWFTPPARPAGLYRFTQGLHVATGLATIPLLLAKLWVVYPKLFTWPPFNSIAMLLERFMLLPLIGGGLFLVFTGLANINLWYPWPFSFPTAHYWVAWVTIGALVVHMGAKLGTTRHTLRRPERTDVDAPERGAAANDRPELAGLRDDAAARRAFLATVLAGAAAVTVFTVGQTLAPLRELALLAPRRPDTGPQGFPVNRTARTAGVISAAQSPDYRLVVSGNVKRPLQLTREDLLAMPQHEATLPIACVEGWSASRQWSGVPVRDVLARAGAREGASVTVVSLQRRRAYRRSELSPPQARDPRHAARAGCRRGNAAPRPRVSRPAHRAEPARSSADEVGHADRRTMTDPSDAPREHGPAFWIAFVVGSGIMAFGVRGMLTNAAAADPATVFGWIVGGDLLHDFFLVPLVLITGAVLVRIVPEPWRTPVRAGLISSALLVAIAWPALRGYGRVRVPDNHSVQPLDYGTAVFTVLAVVWLGVACCWCCVRFVRRSGRRSRAAMPTGSPTRRPRSL